MKRLLLMLALLMAGVAWSASAQTGGLPTVSGRVFDDTTGCPLRGVSLTAVGSTAKTMTDVHGRYYLKGVPTSPFTLQAWLAGYTAAMSDNLVVRDSTARVDFSLLRTATDTGKTKPRDPSMKCVLDVKDSGGRYDRR